MKITIKHGTRSGYDQHRKLGEQPCTECKAANSRASRKYRQRVKIRKSQEER